MKQNIFSAYSGYQRQGAALPISSRMWAVIQRWSPLLRNGLTLLLAVFCCAAIWFGMPNATTEARIVLMVFALTIIGWTLTEINDVYIALGGAFVLALLNADDFGETFAALGDPIIWLMLASFIVAEAIAVTGLSYQLIQRLTQRARSISGLFYALTAALIATAFVIPSTSGRATLMLPIFYVFARLIPNPRIVRAIALLFPTVILLSAFASMTGAGAHLLAVDILVRAGGDRIDFGRWIVLGLPFAVVSCFASTWVILHVFLNREERRQPLSLTRQQLSAEQNASATRAQKRFVLLVVGVMIFFWCTESLHHIDSALVAFLGALALTTPNLGVISFKQGLKKVDWSIILFMAATTELAEALIETGAAQWLIEQFFTLTHGFLFQSPLTFIAVIGVISLLAHLVITSRTARVSVIVPLIIVLAVSGGFNPTMAALLVTAATGFCITLPVSAKPVAMFSQLEGAPYHPRDLLRLSAFLLPLHFVLLVGFALVYLPLVGVSVVGSAEGIASTVYPGGRDGLIRSDAPQIEGYSLRDALSGRELKRQ